MCVATLTPPACVRVAPAGARRCPRKSPRPPASSNPRERNGPLRGFRHGPLLLACSRLGLRRLRGSTPPRRTSRPARRADRAGRSIGGASAGPRRASPGDPRRPCGGDAGGVLQRGDAQEEGGVAPCSAGATPRAGGWGHGTMATVRWPRHDGYGTMATARWPRHDGLATMATARGLRCGGYGAGYFSCFRFFVFLFFRALSSRRFALDSTIPQRAGSAQAARWQYAGSNGGHARLRLPPRQVPLALPARGGGRAASRPAPRPRRSRRGRGAPRQLSLGAPRLPAVRRQLSRRARAPRARERGAGRSLRRPRGEDEEARGRGEAGELGGKEPAPAEPPGRRAGPPPAGGGRWAAEDLGGRRHAGEIPARPRIPQAARPTGPGRLALTQLGLADGTGGPEGPSVYSEGPPESRNDSVVTLSDS